MMEFSIKIFALVVSGRPLNDQVADVLLLNAIDMWDRKRPQQRVKARSYDGMIKSDLEVFEHFGVPVVEFNAMIGTTDFRSTQVKYLVRVDDLDELEPGEWHRLQMSAAMPPLPPGFLPTLTQEEPRVEWN